MEKFHQRPILNHLKRLFQEFPIVAITGPRQVGKTTLLHKLFLPQAAMVTFDPLEDIQNARRDPDLFLKSQSTPLILDEIQYAPEIIPALKRKIDLNRTPGQYLITGSQQWEVMKSLAESLAGRVIFLDLDGFAINELTATNVNKNWLKNYLDHPEDFYKSAPSFKSLPLNPFEQIWRGWFPEAQKASLESIPYFYASYLRTYLDRDVRNISQISNLELFNRFLRYCAALTAQEVNHSKWGQELEINPQTAKSWLALLKATFQWTEIPAFSGNQIKKISQKPKGYFSDTGLICYLQTISSSQALSGHPMWGAVFETAVVQEIRKLCHQMSAPPTIYHWRKHSGAEIDLLLERDGKYYPIEIKGKSHPIKTDCKGIGAFRGYYKKLNIQKGLVIALNDQAYALTENDLALPWSTL